MSQTQTATRDRVVLAEPVPAFMADIGVIWDAVMDVMDSGWKCSSGCDIKHEWHFHPYDEDEEETEHRTKFANLVIARIRELKASPLNLGIKLENYCDRHLRARLPESTTARCADCDVEVRTR